MKRYTDCPIILREFLSTMQSFSLPIPLYTASFLRRKEFFHFRNIPSSQARFAQKVECLIEVPRTIPYHLTNYTAQNSFHVKIQRSEGFRQ